MTKVLEDQPRELQEKKRVTEEKKKENRSKLLIVSKRRIGNGVFVMVVLHNGNVCFNCFIDAIWAACDAKWITTPARISAN